MKRNEIIAIFTCTTLMLSTAAPVMASEVAATTSTTSHSVHSLKTTAVSASKNKDVKITKEEAKKTAINTIKDLFEITIDEKKFQSDAELESDYGIDDHAVWFLDWHMHNDGKSMNISATIDAVKGNIIRANYHEYFQDQKAEMIPSITQEEAAEIAKAFVKKHYPDEYKQLKLEKDTYIYSRGYRFNDYNFTFSREINSIPYPSNSINIGVNGVTGKVISYRCNWDADADFPKADEVIDQQTAEDTFKQNTEMTLRYSPVQDEDPYSHTTKEVKLTYKIDYLNNTYLVDPIKNSMVEFKDEKNLSKEKKKDLTNNQKQKLQKTTKTLSKREKAIDENRAMEIIQKFKKQFFDEKYEISKIELIQDPTDWQSRGRKVWSAEIVKKEGNSEHYFDGIIIDALTEELVSFNNFAIDWDKKEFIPKLTWEEAYDQAAQLLINYFPEQAKQVKTEQTYRDYSSMKKEKNLLPRTYSFYFPRIVQGLEYDQNSISIEFDTETGKLTELECRWDKDLVFPDPSKAISSEKAKQSYFNTHTPQLCYNKIMPNEDTEASTKSQIQLVYMLKADVSDTFINSIDAITGKPLSYNGQEITKEKPDFTQKLKDHPNKKQLQILASSGIIDPKTFVLDQDIPMMEWIKMLVNAKGYRPYMVKQADDLKFTNIEKTNENYKYLQMAVKYDFIENKEEAFDTEAKITREQMAKMLIQMLEYNDLAKMNTVFTVDFTDAKQIDPDFIGSIAIAKGLGIFEDSTFRPKDHATYVESAVSIYKALQQVPEE